MQMAPILVRASASNGVLDTTRPLLAMNLTTISATCNGDDASGPKDSRQMIRGRDPQNKATESPTWATKLSKRVMRVVVASREALLTMLGPSLHPLWTLFAALSERFPRVEQALILGTSEKGVAVASRRALWGRLGPFVLLFWHVSEGAAFQNTWPLGIASRLCEAHFWALGHPCRSMCSTIFPVHFGGLGVDGLGNCKLRSSMAKSGIIGERDAEGAMACNVVGVPVVDEPTEGVAVGSPRPEESPDQCK